MANYIAVLSPNAEADLARLDEVTREAVLATIRNDLRLRAEYPVRMWRRPYLFVGVPVPLSDTDDLRSADVPDEEPSEIAPSQQFVLYRHLQNDPSSADFLVARVFGLAELFPAGPWAVGVEGGFVTCVLTDDREVAEACSRAFRQLLRVAGYRTIIEGADEWGSWLKNWLGRARRSEVPRKLTEAVLASAQDTYVRGPAGEATRALAEAARASLDAMGDNEGCLVFDNLIVLKLRGDDGSLRCVGKELTLAERRILRHHTSLLWDPRTVLRELGAAAADDDAPEPFEIELPD